MEEQAVIDAESKAVGINPTGSGSSSACENTRRVLVVASHIHPSSQI
jgi:hypothetical protein